MKVKVALVALMAANGVQSFSPGGTSIPARSAKSVTGLAMTSKAYEEQLEAFRQSVSDRMVAEQANKPSPAVQEPSVDVPPPALETLSDPAVDMVAAEMLNSSRQAATSAVIVQSEEPKQDGFQKVIYFGVAFLGLPLWLLLSAIVFPPTQQVVPAMSTTQPAITLPSNVLPSAQSAAQPAGVVVLSQPITKAEVRGLFDLWNDALHTLDPATVAKRYAKEGVLLPTLSDVPRTDFEGIKDYFVHFLAKKPDGKIIEGEIFVGNNWAQDAGIYEFTFEDGSKLAPRTSTQLLRAKVKARYSSIYVYEDGKWMISHHHSSLMPEEVVRPKAITQEEVRGLFGLWNDALSTGDPMKVAARYTDDAVLLPTLSDRARYTNEGIADYFVHFLEKKPEGRIVEGNIKIGPNWAQDAGIYEFSFADGSSVQGRYSFVYAFENGEWKISNHHSSIMPEGAVAAMKTVAEMKVEN